MASWQFDLHLIPRESVTDRGGGPLTKLDPEQSFEHHFWRNCESSGDLETAVSSELQEGCAWTKDLRTWGREDGNRIDIFYNDGRIDCVFVRIDLRNLHYGFLRFLAHLALDLNCVFLTEGNAIVEAKYDELAESAANSDAKRFVENPHCTLDEFH